VHEDVGLLPGVPDELDGFGEVAFEVKMLVVLAGNV
jgi:hypothetical protein